MEEEPDWAKALNELHQGQLSHTLGDLSTPGEFKVYDIEEYLLKVTDLNEKEVKEAIQYLDDMGLISGITIAGEEMKLKGGLTEEGFRIAHEREMRKRQQSLLESQNDATRTLATFTVILGVAALVQAAAAVMSVPNPYNFYLAGFYAIVLSLLLWTKDDWVPK